MAGDKRPVEDGAHDSELGRRREDGAMQAGVEQLDVPLDAAEGNERAQRVEADHGEVAEGDRPAADVDKDVAVGVVAAELEALDLC